MGKLAAPPVLYRYLKQYQQDPSSRVFAPLAEAYRKAGLVDEAIEIAREGLLVHPGFVGGRVALARALFDKKLYTEVIEELVPVVRDVPDNLAAQKVLAESLLMVGRLSEALSAYKMLLYFSPHDTEVARLVQEIESEAYTQGGVQLRTDPETPVEFEIRDVNTALASDPQLKHQAWLRRVECLQSMLQRVERYRMEITQGA